MKRDTNPQEHTMSDLKAYEIRVTVEALHPDTGEVMESFVHLAGVEDGDAEPSLHGDVEALLDDLISTTNGRAS